MDEMLDLYHIDGTPAGCELRRGELPPKGLYWRTCDVWLMNSRGELLVQRRALNKAAWPGWWCYHGGAVQSGETDEAGCIRECTEELGLRPDMDHGGMIFTWVGEHGLHQVWLFCQDAELSDLTLQQEEVADARWVTVAELRRMVKEGEFVPTEYLPQLLQMLPVYASCYGKEE